MPESAVFDELLDSLAQGRHVSQCVRLAKAVVADHGERSAPSIQELASLGNSSGGNQERDLHRWLRGVHGFQVDPYFVTFNLANPAGVGTVPLSVPILLPHELLGQIWAAGDMAWSASVLGPTGCQGVAELWRHLKNLPDFTTHPHVLGSRGDQDALGRGIPVLFHVDGAEVYRNVEYHIWSWGSALTDAGDVLDRKLPIVMIPEESIKDPDARVSAHRTICEVIAWSMQCAATGKYPERGFNGEAWAPGTTRACQAGQLIADGWTMFFVGFKADGKARVQANGFGCWYQCVHMCESCLAVNCDKGKRVDQLLSFKDFREEAAWVETEMQHEDYLRYGGNSPWLAVPGWRLGLCFHDMMHAVHLGIVRDVIPAALQYLLDQDTHSDRRADGLKLLWVNMKSWCSNRMLHVPRPEFTVANTGVDTPFPELGSAFKAAGNRVILAWLCDKFLMLERRLCRQGRLILCCMWSLSQCLSVLEHAELILRPAEAEAAYAHGRRHLLLWGRLAVAAARQGKCMYKHRPKHHWFDHLIRTIRKGRVNVLRWSCFIDEDYMGRMKRLGRATDRRLCSLRSLQRWGLVQGFRYHRRQRQGRWLL